MTASITSPLRHHIHRASSSTPNLIVNWVHRLERLNATLDESSQPEGSSSAAAGVNNRKSSTATTRQEQRNLTKRSYHQVVTIIGNEDEDHTISDGSLQSDESEAELCFKGAQLATEFLLMMFAASLLLIAAIVVFSRKIPAFMESYEIVPKLLFFLCLFVAIYSFIRWLALKIKHKIKQFGSKPPPPQASAEIDQLGRKSCEHKATSQADKTTGRQTHDSSGLEAPLLPQNASKSRQQQQWSNLNTRTRSAAACHPPTRQVAFDSPNLLSNEFDGSTSMVPELTIDEESDHELSCASA